MTLDLDMTPQSLVDGLVRLLDVQEHSADLYVGGRVAGRQGRVFGGEIIAQALMAAARTVDPHRACHSLHAYFIRGGSENHPTEYRVSRDFDGRSFSTRRVTAVQQGEVILNLAASFQVQEDGLEHQDVMPDVPPPEGLKSDAELRVEYAENVPEQFKKNFLRPQVVDFRPLSPRHWTSDAPAPARQQSWFKLAAPVEDDPLIHRAILAYISDMQLLGTCALPHGLSWMRGELMSASLDHALWLHDDFRVDDWLLFTSTSPVSRAGRGLNHAQIWSRDGRLVASVAQEGLIRKRRI
jgi:acyl-CoA thioesterase II